MYLLWKIKDEETVLKQLEILESLKLIIHFGTKRNNSTVCQCYLIDFRELMNEKNMLSPMEEMHGTPA